MFDWINEFFMNALRWIDSWVGNYGWSVVVFTLIIRLILMPLDIKSRRSMRAMNKMQPKLAVLQKKYANDKDKLNQKTMELYRKENISPMSGCLPLLLQWPVLIFMFTAMRVFANEQTIQMILDLKEGKDLALEGWLWIKNVFQPDSFTSTILPKVGDTLMAITKVNYSKILTQENIDTAKAFLATSEYATAAAQYGGNAFHSIQLNFAIARPVLTLPTSIANLFEYANGLFILPILAAVSQFFMTKLSNIGAEPQSAEEKKALEAQQANNSMNSGFMKWFFPIFSLWICATSNSAFSIYWMAVNIISIAQTWGINKYLDHCDKKTAGSSMTVDAK